MSLSMKRSRTALLLAGVFGVLGVAIGALGAHGLKATLLARGTLAAFETGARYHLLHVLAIFAAAIWLRVGPGKAETSLTWAVRCWALGIVLFSGSLYWLALGGPRWLGPVTPLGGIFFLSGWALVLVSAFARDE